MGWDYGFFIAKNNVFRKPEQPRDQKTAKHTLCARCNYPIGVVSTTLYEIEGKCYCPDCYVRMVGNKANERDHPDLQPLQPIAP